jgi:DNA-binding MarR family transcriptional regulator
MTDFFLRNLPRCDCLLEVAERYPQLKVSAAEVYLRLQLVATDQREYSAAWLAEHGLSVARFTVLMLLNRPEGGPTNPAELAEQMTVSRATITGLLDGLERDELVRRLPDERDRRMFSLELTAKARKLLGDILPEYFGRVSALLEPLSEAESNLLVDLLEKLHARAATLRGNGAASEGSPAGE